MAICLRPGAGTLEILFILRALDDDDPWSGHVAFPGGRREPGDETLWDTAVRETFEETGLDLALNGHRLGQLDDVHPRTSVLPSIAITPYAFSVAADASAQPGPEVQEVAWIPLADLVAPASRSQIEIRTASGARSYPSTRYGRYEIWGLTHRILTQLLELVEEDL